MDVAGDASSGPEGVGVANGGVPDAENNSPTSMRKRSDSAKVKRSSSFRNRFKKKQQQHSKYMPKLCSGIRQWVWLLQSGCGQHSACVNHHNENQATTCNQDTCPRTPQNQDTSLIRTLHSLISHSWSQDTSLIRTHSLISHSWSQDTSLIRTHSLSHSWSQDTSLIRTLLMSHSWSQDTSLIRTLSIPIFKRSHCITFESQLLWRSPRSRMIHQLTPIPSTLFAPAEPDAPSRPACASSSRPGRASTETPSPSPWLKRGGAWAHRKLCHSLQVSLGTL